MHKKNVLHELYKLWFKYDAKVKELNKIKNLSSQDERKARYEKIQIYLLYMTQISVIIDTVLE